MRFTMAETTNGTQEAKLANNYPHIRLFTVGQKTSSPDEALMDFQTVLQPWTVANQESVLSYSDEYFSSVCWFFGKEISDALENQVPIGLISNNWGGTRVEQWRYGGDLFNAMIHPYMIGPMSLSGFAWYQGEANMANQNTADEYSQLFSGMIQ